MNTPRQRNRGVPAWILLTVLLPGCGSGGSAPSPAGPAPAPAAGASPSVGASGGSVSLLGGSVRLSVPPGALGATVAIDARATNATPLDPWAVAATTFEITPAGTSFSTPATLTLRYQASLRPSGTSVQDLRIHRFTGNAWQSLGGNNDIGAFEASASIQSGGIYAIRWTGPSAPCALPEDRHFDFWLGEWNLNEVTPQGVVFQGTNRISVDDTGCVIEEDYRSAGQGRSISLFSRIDQRWHQTYIDSMGNRLILIGGFANSRMLLTSGATRSYWEPLDRDNVRFVQEQSRDGGQTWTPYFDSRYSRR